MMQQQYILYNEKKRYIKQYVSLHQHFLAVIL